MGVSKYHLPYYRPQIREDLLQGHPQEGLPTDRSSQIKQTRSKHIGRKPSLQTPSSMGLKYGSSSIMLLSCMAATLHSGRWQIYSLLLLRILALGAFMSGLLLKICMVICEHRRNEPGILSRNSRILACRVESFYPDCWGTLVSAAHVPQLRVSHSKHLGCRARQSLVII